MSQYPSALVDRLLRKPPAPVVAGPWEGTGAHKRKLPHAALLGWVAQGITNNADLAELCLRVEGVSATRQAILYWRRQYDDTYQGRYESENRPRLIPWRPIAREHNNDTRYRALLTEARIQDGQVVTQADKLRHAKVKRDLAAAGGVITYDRANGFQVVPKRPGVDLGWIREPDNK